MTTRESQGQIEAIHGIEAVLRNRRRGDGSGDGLGKPVAGAHAIRSSSWTRSGSIFAGVEHGPKNRASAILPDGSGDVLGLWFRANESTTVRAKDLNALRNAAPRTSPSRSWTASRASRRTSRRGPRRSGVDAVRATVAVVKNRRAIVFEDRFPMAPSKRQRTEFRTVSHGSARR